MRKRRQVKDLLIQAALILLLIINEVVASEYMEKIYKKFLHELTDVNSATMGT